MKKILTVMILAFVVSSCNKEFDKAMKSTDKEVILQTADKYFEQKKWRQALALYERLPNLVAGTDDAANVNFKSAYANYYDRNYKLAGHQFKSFVVANPQDSRKEEAAYMSAICYYQDSRDYNLDQESTLSAINELQDFLNTYPNSERAKNISQLIDELSYKLEFKAYESARQYYKMADYKAAVIVFENVLEDYPATKLKDKIVNYILKSKEQLAIHSVYDLKEERLDNALAYTRQVELEFPNTENSKEALEVRKHLEDAKVAFEKTKKEVEARKAEREAKLKKLNADLDSKKIEEIDKTTEAAKDYVKKVRELRKDSAQKSTPKPAAIINLKNKK
ncbi:outer membrane protein assembly factor BamD [Elizabethkingia sp. JS20170427COW]|uniref:outer membrane protein assembly factor BamD n=1 Tax=Elizabethkingia sp. JS20170427COW TaxID=2583851 RepID=UPI001110589B|nr:outer membrane protein assembly factor BamD [Elizabethkingia sp. JS20170427COW]QCX53202.1 outer membrane protein assembly factor BamD [Elizabethkingia sp. JS20170427COW]